MLFIALHQFTLYEGLFHFIALFYSLPWGTYCDKRLLMTLFGCWSWLALDILHWNYKNFKLLILENDMFRVNCYISGHIFPYYPFSSSWSSKFGKNEDCRKMHCYLVLLGFTGSIGLNSWLSRCFFGKASCEIFNTCKLSRRSTFCLLWMWVLTLLHHALW